MVVILYPVINILYEDIKNTNFKVSDPTIFEIMRDNVKFEFLISYKTGSEAIILGTGNAHREKYPLPIFVRHSWTKDFKQTSIFYADPTLYYSDLSLTWYYGTNKRWYLEEIADIVKLILDSLNINVNDTLCFGSSGGGYSSLILAILLKTKATVINPQCNILNYNQDYLSKFSEAVADKGGGLVTNRLNVVEIMKMFNYMPYIHYIQNVKSKYDLKDQLFPFLKALDENNIYCSEKLLVDFYSDLGGHNAMPSKAYCLKVIESDLNKEAYMDKPLFLSDDFITTIDGCGITTEINYSNKLLSIDIVQENNSYSFKYAYYLLDMNNVTIEKKGYSEKRHCDFKILRSGKYRIKYFITINNQRYSFLSELIDCTG